MKNIKITVLILVLVACIVPVAAFATGQTETGTAAEEATTISWHIRSSEPANFESVMAELNQRLEARMNVQLDLVPMEPSEWGQRMSLMMAAGEELDLTWAANWGGFSYLDAWRQGAYTQLTDDLLRNVDETMAIIPESFIEAVRTPEGDLYAIPNYQVTYNQWGVYFRTSIADSYGIDTASVSSIEDLTEVFQVIKDNEPTIYPLVRTAGLSIMVADKYMEENIYSSGLSNRAWDLSGTPELISSPIDRETWEIVREWNLSGFLSPDVMTFEDTDAQFRSGDFFANFGRTKPGGDADLSRQWGFDVFSMNLSQPILQSPIPTMTAVARTSPDPEVALQLFNLFNTDAEFYNMLIFGLEGQDYIKTGENRIEPKEDSYRLPAWMMGNQFNAYLQPGQPDDVWEQTVRGNQAAVTLPTFGFNFDRAPVAAEWANVQAVSQEYGPVLDNGVGDVDDYANEFEEKLQEAGIEAVEAEMERQFREWYAQNN